MSRLLPAHIRPGIRRSGAPLCLSVQVVSKRLNILNMGNILDCVNVELAREIAGYEVVRMDEGTMQFVEKMGLLFEGQGVSRSASRIAGWLLVAKEPQALDDLAEALQISKASASINTRLLERYGMIEKVSKTGDRRVYYRIGEDVWITMLEYGLAKMHAFTRLARKGQRLVGEGNALAQRRLRQMEQIYSHLRQRMGCWLEEIRQELSEGDPS